MSLSVVFLKSAEQDVKELKHYVIRRFGVETWQSTLSKLKESIHTLQAHPQAGKVPDELRTLNPGLFRQICKTACKTFQISGVISVQKLPPWVV